jgi:hypothetical protein
MGVVVLFVTSYVVEVAYQALSQLLAAPSAGELEMATRLDLTWALHHLAQSLVYALPFALWRGFQHRGRRAAPSGAVTPTA